MEQNGYRDIPAKITKKFTKVVPAAVSTATTNLSSLTLEHNFKDVFKKARKQLWQKSSDHSEDCEESKRVAEVDNLIVFDDDKSTRQSPLERGSAVRASECSSVRNKTKSNANVKGQQPVHLSAKPHSKWHVRPPLPDIIDEPIKPVSSTTCSQPITPKAFQVTMDSSKTHPAPANRHLRNKATPVLLPGDATRPVPLPRNSSRPSSVVNQVTPQTSDPSPLHRLSRPQSHSDFAPVPLPRKKFPSKPCNDGAASSADVCFLHSYFETIQLLTSYGFSFSKTGRVTAHCSMLLWRLKTLQQIVAVKLSVQQALVALSRTAPPTSALFASPVREITQQYRAAIFTAKNAHSSSSRPKALVTFANEILSWLRKFT